MRNKFVILGQQPWNFPNFNQGTTFLFSCQLRNRCLLKQVTITCFSAFTLLKIKNWRKTQAYFNCLPKKKKLKRLYTMFLTVHAMLHLCFLAIVLTTLFSKIYTCTLITLYLLEKRIALILALYFVLHTVLQTLSLQYRLRCFFMTFIADDYQSFSEELMLKIWKWISKN